MKKYLAGCFYDDCNIPEGHYPEKYYTTVERKEGVTMAYIENIVIGTPIVEPCLMFAKDEIDWKRVEQEKNYFTEERYLPKILVALGIYPSINEIRRNKPELMITFDKIDFVNELKVSKKRKVWIQVGEQGMYKQIIIVRRDLDLSPGKLSGQVSHASMAFLTNMLKEHVLPAAGEYKVESFTMEKGLYENWINDIFTKVVLKAKNKNQLMKAVKMAEDLGMEEGKDFFLIKDCCLTELTPEEVDENGVGRTLTCIGFRPMEETVIDQIGRKYQLYN